MVLLIEFGKLGRRIGFVEVEDEFGFEYVCFVILEEYLDIWLEDYNVGLSF